ncbi:hypothetical protein [Corynebacterium sp. HMSC05E07]|nr:hypothetical protein [Corynebacterium sp. HMSC05E07]
MRSWCDAVANAVTVMSPRRGDGGLGEVVAVAVVSWRGGGRGVAVVWWW